MTKKPYKQPEMPKDLRDKLDDAFDEKYPAVAANDKFKREADAAGRRVDAYLDTISRIEPDITAIDASAFYASVAISAKRQADALERIATILEKQTGIAELLSDELRG